MRRPALNFQVVGLEREIALHHRSREYSAQMRQLYHTQVAQDWIEVRFELPSSSFRRCDEPCICVDANANRSIR